MRRILTAVVVMAVCWPAVSQAQGVLGNLLSGDLVNPQVGAWAWYDLKDAATGKAFVVRMALVGEEKVGSQNGYWLEIEIVPLVGYRSVYKMLLTGPAKDPANIRRMLAREGTGEPQEIPLDAAAAEAAAPQSEPERKLVGAESIKTLDGKAVASEHYELSADDGKTDIWLNDQLPPMGLVKLKSPQGELSLRNSGSGGQDARSVIDEPPVLGAAPGDAVKVDVKVDKEPKHDDDKTDDKAKDEAKKPVVKPKAAEPAKPTESKQ